MAEEKIYPFAVAHIRALENKLLTKQALNQMTEAKDVKEIIRVLTDLGYGANSNADDYEYENILAKELVKTYSLVKELVPDSGISELFLHKNDYHNLKVLLKSEFIGSNPDNYIINNGNIPTETLKTIIMNRNYTDLSETMTNAINETYDVYSKTKNGQLIDITLDKAIFKSMKQTALKSNNTFLIKYVEILADITNLKSFTRIINMGKPIEAFLNVFVEGGSLNNDKFKRAFISESAVDIFKTTSYSDICEGMTKGFTYFERLCDDYIMNYVKTAKTISLTYEPLLAYIYAKEIEVKTLRIIMSGKMNGISADTLKERLRDAYV